MNKEQLRQRRIGCLIALAILILSATYQSAYDFGHSDGVIDGREGARYELINNIRNDGFDVVCTSETGCEPIYDWQNPCAERPKSCDIDPSFSIGGYWIMDTSWGIKTT